MRIPHVASRTRGFMHGVVFHRFDLSTGPSTTLPSDSRRAGFMSAPSVMPSALALPPSALCVVTLRPCFGISRFASPASMFCVISSTFFGRPCLEGQTPVPAPHRVRTANLRFRGPTPCPSRRGVSRGRLRSCVQPSLAHPLCEQAPPPCCGPSRLVSLASMCCDISSTFRRARASNVLAPLDQPLRFVALRARFGSSAPRMSWPLSISRYVSLH